MPKVTIDGNEADLEDGLTVLQAAESLGIEVPHYCYHPGLSIAGNCRMCLVEIEKMPKLQIGCNTRIADGMVVHTRNDRVKKAQQSVLEFLLINHPIDCPICDQAGECKLQDYYMDFDKERSRFPVEEKVHKGKAIDVGPRVMLDQERCILCLRCTRFLDEVTHTSELAVQERGDHAKITLAPGKRLDNPYSENVVDICPVGALTSKPFRFRSRVWYLDRTSSVCTGCARGCSIDVFHKQGEMFRFRPRPNPEVNGYWMCDVGRDGVLNLQGENRLLAPRIRVGEELHEEEWDSLLTDVRDRFARIRREHGSEAVAAIIGAHATNEEAFLVREWFANELAGGTVVGHAPIDPSLEDDDLLLRADRHPNRAGLEALGLSCDPAEVENVLARAKQGKLRAILAVRADVVGELGREATESGLEALDAFVVADSLQTETGLYADVLLPIGMFAESDGTYTNFEGRVQLARQAYRPRGRAREGWRVLSALSRARGLESASDVFDRVAADAAAFSGLSHEALGPHGALLGS